MNDVKKVIVTLGLGDGDVLNGDRIFSIKITPGVYTLHYEDRVGFDYGIFNYVHSDYFRDTDKIYIVNSVGNDTIKVDIPELGISFICNTKGFDTFNIAEDIQLLVNSLTAGGNYERV